MRKLSKQQLIFAIVSIVLTVVFLYTLNHFIDTKIWKNINIIAIAYGALMFVNGLANGYFDDDRFQRFDLGFRYHIITFLTVNSMHLIFVLLPDSNYTFTNFILSALFWGIGVFGHYQYARKTIKGYTPEELFE